MGLTTDRNDPGLGKIEASGQQEKYLVLSEEERAQGFVRPVRRTYRHVACGADTSMGRAIAETYARNPKFYNGTFCCACGTHFDLKDSTGKPAFFWVDRNVQTDEPVGSTAEEVEAIRAARPPESAKKTCPRRAGSFMQDFKFLNRPEDGTCDYCGSLDEDTFMARLEAGDVKLTPTDKNYKVYVVNDGGEPFKQTYRTDNAQNSDQTQWTWTTREMPEAKFYFDHLSDAQKQRFVELLNAKKLKLDYPGHFYRLPFFVE